MVSWIVATLTACAILFAGGLFVVLFLRYRRGEKEQIARAELWIKRSRELVEEMKEELDRETGRHG